MSYQCTSCVAPALERISGRRTLAQNNSGDTVWSLVNAMFSRSVDSCAEERSESLAYAGEIMRYSCALFHMDRSANMLSDVRMCDGNVRISGNHLIDVVGYGIPTVLSPGDMTGTLLDVAHALDLEFVYFHYWPRISREWDEWPKKGVCAFLF